MKAGEKLFRSAEAPLRRAQKAVAADKVGFARAVVEALSEDADDDLRSLAISNFERLFALIRQAQRASIRHNGREQVRHAIGRFKRAFLRDHPTTATRAAANNLLEDIEGNSLLSPRRPNVCGPRFG